MSVFEVLFLRIFIKTIKAITNIIKFRKSLGLALA